MDEQKGKTSKHKGFNWKWAKERAIIKQLERSIHLTRCNPDYQIAHPQECRDNPDNENICHPEAKRRITKDMLHKQQRAIVPPVERPKRLSK